jgi:hypothetical protein
LTRSAWVWRVLAVLVALTVTATLGYFITRIPIQLMDGGSNMIGVADTGPWQLFIEKMTQGGFFRPLMWPPYRLVMDWSGGAYFAWFKTIHVVQVFVLLLVFARLLRVENATDLTAFGFAVAVLVGGHTFPGTVREAFPINHFLSVAICTLGVVVLAAEPRRLINDVLAILLFVYATLTLESGLLVWVAVTWAWWLGWRGVSRSAVGAITVGVAAYMVLRFGWFDVGLPGLIERASGFGFVRLEGDELQRRFGSGPLLFYVYNVFSALLSLLFAEPRAGVYSFVRGLVRGSQEPWTLLNVICAAGVTVLVALAFWHRRGIWRDDLSHHDRLLAMMPVLVVANSVFCYVYLKDVVLSVAGIFVAAAAYVAMRDTLSSFTGLRWRLTSVVAAMALTVLSAAWSVKFIGIHYSIRKESIAVRKEWAQVDGWLAREGSALNTPAKRSVKGLLEMDALRRQPVAPWPALPWSVDWFDETQ